MLLVSDLDDDSGDVDRVSQVAIAYRRAGIPLHVVGLNAAPEDAAFIRRVRDREGIVRAGGAPVRASERLLGELRSAARRRSPCSPPSASTGFLLLAEPLRWRRIVSVWRLVLGVGAIVLGVAALALAHDIRAWHGACRRAVTRASPCSPLRRAGREHVARRRSGTGCALGLGDDLGGSPRRAGVRRRDADAEGIRRRPPAGAGSGRSPSSPSPTAVAAGSPAQASRAGNLLGILAAHGRRRADAAVGERRAAETFEAAIRADPANDDAKYNLELLLRRIKVVGSREGAGGSAGYFGHSLTGAGAGLPGSGY